VLANTTHGMRRSREYSAWNAMLSRCNNPHAKDYADYGAAGIRVSEFWHTFENFLADMGPRPTGTTIERLDGTGDYCSGNCKWATYGEQAQNRRSTIFVTLPVSELERMLGMRGGSLVRRIRNGWDDSMAIATPIQEQFVRNHQKEI
jgi:hypothetical protein